LILKKSEVSAELIGIILGDGCLTRISRTERLLVSLDSRAPDQVSYVASLIEQVLKEKPVIEKQKGLNCSRVYLYRNGISKELGLPLGNKIQKAHDDEL